MMTTQTLSLTDFLLARIAEDEVKATLRAWHAEGCRWLPDEAGYTYPCDCGVPEWLKAECEAKRLLMRGHRAVTLEGEFIAEPFVLRALALPYADHRDYREEWRP